VLVTGAKGERQKLVENPDAIPNAVEEMLR